MYARAQASPTHTHTCACSLPSKPQAPSIAGFTLDSGSRVLATVVPPVQGAAPVGIRVTALHRPARLRSLVQANGTSEVSLTLFGGKQLAKLKLDPAYEVSTTEIGGQCNHRR